MKILVLNIETELSINNQYYLTHISYIIYNMNTLNIILIKTHDINLYHNAHKIIFNKKESLDNYKIKNIKIINIIAILKYYLDNVNKIVCYDACFIKKVLNQECERSNIDLVINDNIELYCLMKTSNKIFNWNIVSGETTNEQNENIYIIYQKIFYLSYCFKYNKTLLLCMLILRCYYKFVTSYDLEKYDLNLVRLRILNS